MQTAAALPGTPFNPTQISGCVLWLDANDRTTVTLSGSTVTQINDKSGNGNNTSSSTGTVSYAATGLNGFPAFSFNATGGFRGPTSITGTTLTAFTVATLNSGVNYNGRLFGLANATQNDYAYATTGQPFFCRNGGPNVSGYRNNTYMSYQTNTFDTPFIGTSQFTGSSNITSINGTSGTAVADANGSFSITKYGFGCEGFSDSGINWYGYCSEMILYNSLLSTAQQKQVEGYLAQKWGLRSSLPQDHPGQKGIIYPMGTRQRLASPIAYYQNFTPLQISGCQLWLDAADATKFTFSSGSNISGWLDKSPSANNLTTASGTPVYTTDGALSVVNIPSGAVLQTTANLVITTSSAFFVVAKLTSAATGYPMLITLIDNNSGDYSIRYSGSVVNFGNSDDIGNGSYYTNGSPNANASFLNQYVIIDTTTATRAATSRVAVSGTFSGRYFIGNVLEVIIYPGGVNSTQRSQLQSYLAAKWNLVPQIPTSHLHFTRPAGMPGFTPSLQIQAIPLSRYVFNYVSNFSLTNFTVGGTFTPVISSGTLQLANNGGSQGNYAWHIQKQSITNFQTTFIMNFQSTNADGSAFVIQNSSSTAVGSVGGGLAYQGIGTSLAITLKSYNGSAGQFSTEVLTGGSAPTLTGASGVLNTSLGLTAGGTWNLLVNVKYNGTNLNYTITNTANSNSYTSNAPYNIPSLVGANTAYVGFTTGTGGLAEYCYLNSWNYATLNLPA